MTQSNVTDTTLLIVGALHVDEVATVQGPFVLAASNPVSWQRSTGGVAANVARAAQRVYKQNTPHKYVNFHAAVGADATGASIAQCIEGLGVSLHAHCIQGRSTGRYSVVMDEAGELLMGLADVSVAEYLQAEHVLPHLDAVGNGFLFMDANLSAQCIDRLIMYAAQHLMPVAMVCVSPSKALKLPPHAQQIDLIFCNRREALAMAIDIGLIPAGISAENVCASHLAELLGKIGFSSYVLTDGSQVVHICENGQSRPLEVPAVSVSNNVNGAGDALAGATLAAMSRGLSLFTAVSDYGLPIAADVLTGRHLPPSLDYS